MLEDSQVRTQTSCRIVDHRGHLEKSCPRFSFVFLLVFDSLSPMMLFTVRIFDPEVEWMQATLMWLSQEIYMFTLKHSGIMRKG